ncbi:MAG: hypothetical protein COA52_05415 [Hyphomicrobiales bacterium]|nr:prolyl-tRNA synthetase associated domain-containing protein [Hyphomicrobiales bacterium]PCJ94301.1 MAG: hypothetical protein COA52_05415 [Hyphomicrobiales bacterium]
MITRDTLFEKLDMLGIAHRTMSHPPLFTVEDSKLVHDELPGGHAKNLFLKDKKGQLFLLVAEQASTVNMKTLHKQFGSARLSFGKPELLMDILGMIPGAVNPFSVMNDSQGRCKVWLDKALLVHELVNFHPLENTSTTTITSKDLLRFLDAVDHPADEIDLTLDLTATPAA